MKYLATITTEWGARDLKSFGTAEEREAYLEKNEETISSVVLETAGDNFIISALKTFDDSGSFYDPSREMTDYEMDMYL